MPIKKDERDSQFQWNGTCPPARNGTGDNSGSLSIRPRRSPTIQHPCRTAATLQPVTTSNRSPNLPFNSSHATTPRHPPPKSTPTPRRPNPHNSKCYTRPTTNHARKRQGRPRSARRARVGGQGVGKGRRDREDSQFFPPRCVRSSLLTTSSPPSSPSRHASSTPRD